jgi:hypothetical protein
MIRSFSHTSRAFTVRATETRGRPAGGVIVWWRRFAVSWRGGRDTTGHQEDGKHHGAISCSFCGKGQRDVRKLVAGPKVYICDECISLCTDIMIEERAGELSAAAEAQRTEWEALAPKDAQAAAARLVKACEADPRVPQVIADLAVALAVALDKHLTPTGG